MKKNLYDHERRQQDRWLAIQKAQARKVKDLLHTSEK